MEIIDFADDLHTAIGRHESDGHWRPGYCNHFLIGNGGSRAVCSHIATDMAKMGFPAFVVGDSSSLSMAANDEGWDYGYSYLLRKLTRPGDTLIAISSSGRSTNIIDAAQTAKMHKCGVVTFTGFDADNPLRQLGHINYWIPSRNYGIVELATAAILHAIVNPGSPPSPASSPR